VVLLKVDTPSLTKHLSPLLGFPPLSPSDIFEDSIQVIATSPSIKEHSTDTKYIPSFSSIALDHMMKFKPIAKRSVGFDSTAQKQCKDRSQKRVYNLHDPQGLSSMRYKGVKVITSSLGLSDEVIIKYLNDLHDEKMDRLS